MSAPRARGKNVDAPMRCAGFPTQREILMTLQQSPWKKEHEEEKSEGLFGVHGLCLGEVDAG